MKCRTVGVENQIKQMLMKFFWFNGNGWWWSLDYSTVTSFFPFIDFFMCQSLIIHNLNDLIECYAQLKRFCPRSLPPSQCIFETKIIIWNSWFNLCPLHSNDTHHHHHHHLRSSTFSLTMHENIILNTQHVNEMKCVLNAIVVFNALNMSYHLADFSISCGPFLPVN